MDIQQAAYAFHTDSAPARCEPFGNGHINQTFLITTQLGHRFVLQHINKNVFKDPVGLMENASGVTDYILAHGGKALRFLLADGKACHRDAQGEYWRAYEYVDGLCLESAQNADDFYQSGLAFGTFQNQLLDYPAHTLHETIPNFHNTPDRYRQLREAVAENRAGRLDTCREELEFYLSQEERGGQLMAMLAEGKLPLRVTHNDTKLNNVLLDPVTHQPLCVLDLDTVMPGLAAFDFGDSIRFGAATAAEDEPDAGKMQLELGLFEAFTRGFLEGAKDLTENELRSLPLGAFTMTLECGSRFLTDYLNGDTYFRTHYDRHNLVRTRTQIAMCRDMLKKWEQMEAIVARLAGL